MESYLLAFQRYFDFSSRSRRRDFWMFVVFNFIVLFSFKALDGLFFDKMIGTNGVLEGIYSFFILIPYIALSVRRLHDIGKSGFWLLIGIIPVIGLIVLIVFFCKNSEMGSNKYGPNPKV